MRVVGLFAGIGGIELGLERSGGFETELFCESWGPARAVLANRFDRSEAEIARDVATLRSLPAGTEVLTAGFPCTDLSQAGRTAGMAGSQSGLVAHVFRLLKGAARRRALPTWLVIENVSNMLQLGRGEAMRFVVEQLDSLRFRWAYRVVDSRFAGVPQRRRRVVLVASKSEDPTAVLFADDAGYRPASDFRSDAFGFFWTEGRGGLGWAQDAVPTLKGGSTVGIPSPPAIWVPNGDIGRKLVTPEIGDAEELQGFPRGWTEVVDSGTRNGPRWKLVGNAVTVGVAEWLGKRLAAPGASYDRGEPWNGPGSWPTAAHGRAGKVFQVPVSEFPEHRPYVHLLDLVDLRAARPLTYRGARGFWSRLQESNLGRHPGFRDDVGEHVEVTDPVAEVEAAS
jgi:DNA (cytosine-5)-methyltransferase 1